MPLTPRTHAPGTPTLDPPKPASQAYYDSIAEQYASWEVDLVKIDCISDHPYRGEEIRMFHQAITKSGRPMVFTLSPGPTSNEKLDEVSQYSQMWRISDDVWDVWASTSDFPQGPKDQFARMARWAGVAKPGHWPDADMLPLGSLRPSPGWGEPRDCRLTHDEQRTMLTEWSIFRSPLIMGGNLLESDEWTTSLLTNREVLAVDQHSTGNHPVITTNNLVVWTARPESSADFYVAIFNISDTPQTAQYAWKDLGLPAGRYTLRDLWEHKSLGSRSDLSVTLRPHASSLLRASPHR
jgi:alpha-galactosidase